MKRSYPFAWLSAKMFVALGWCILGCMSAQAQFTVINSKVVVKPNTLFSVEGLTFNPAAEITFTKNQLRKSDDPVDYAGSPSVNQVFVFGAPFAYTGILRFPYTDAMLSGEPASNLRLIYAPEEGGPFTLIPQTVVIESERFAEYNFETSTTLQQLSALAADVMPPVVTAIQVSGTPLATAEAVQFTVVFDEVPANASITDFSITASGTASGTIASISPVNANTITVTVDNIAGTGALRLDVKANSGITDTEGNGNGTNGYVAAFTSGEEHAVDREAPDAPSQPVLDPASDTGTSNSDGITSDNTPTLTGTAEANSTVRLTSDADGVLGTVTANGSGMWAFAPGTPLTDGPHELTATATDAAGNMSVASAALTIVIDTEPPTLYISSDMTALKAGETAELTFTISEPVTSFSAGDVTVSGGTLSGLSGSITDYTATFVPTANTTVTATVDVAAGRLTDAAGNGNTAATQLTILVDTDIPDGYTVSIDQAEITLVNQSALSFTFSGAEVNTTFDYTITSSGGGTPISGSGTVADAGEQITGIDVSGLANGTLTVSVTLTDPAGNEGNPATDNVTKSVNHPPQLTASGGLATFTEPVSGSPEPVAVDDGLSVFDLDNETLASAVVAIAGNFQAGEDVLGFTNNGLTMGNIAGSYNAGIGSLTLTSAGATATLVQWQAALRAVAYSNTSATPNTAARTVSFTVSDGVDNSAPATRTVNVVAVNTAPVVTLPATIALVEDVSVALTGISFADADAGAAPVTTTFSVPAGSLAATSGSGVTVGGTGSALILTGAIADINAFIAASGLTYTPAANATADVTLTVKINDNGHTGPGGAQQDSGTVTLQIAAVNDAPVITAPGSITVTEDEASAITGISFSDVDAGMGMVTATFSVPSGTLAATSGGGISVSGSGTSVLTITGTMADINAFIASSNVTYTTALNATSNVVLTVNINDNGNTGSGGSQEDTVTVTLVVTAVNDAPVNTVPGAQSVDQDGVLVFSTGNGNAISVSDADAGGGSILVSLTATNGLLKLGGTTGLTFIIGNGTADETMEFEGTIADINLALNGLSFMPMDGYNGPASLQIVSDDLGLTGAGGNQTDTDVIAITVNPINPRITGVNAPGPDELYKIGDIIWLTVSFDQPVFVNTSGGIPTLLLETGSVDREAAYISGSESNTLTFNYTVQAGDISADLDYTSTGALALNGATIRNSSALDAVLTLPAPGSPSSLAGQHDIVIDGVAPTVTSVAVPVNGYYREGDILSFTVNLSENVALNTTGGTPYLEVTIGTAIVQASYVSGSGTSALVFHYTIQSGDMDMDGIALGSSIVPGGGTLRDAAGNDAVPALSNAGGTGGVLVNTAHPSVTLSTTAASPTNRAFAVSIVFSEAVTGFSPGDLSTTNATLSNLQTADNIMYTVQVTPLADGAVTIQVPAGAAQNIGNNDNTASNALSLKYDGTAPAVIARNVTVYLDASGTAGITAGDIDNGSADASGIAGMVLSQYDFDCSHAGDNTVTLTVTDAAGNIASADATVTVVDNIAPAVAARDITVYLDASGTVSINTADINNGSSDACGIATITLNRTGFDRSHLGDNTVTLTVTDVNGNRASADATVTVVDNIAPVVTSVGVPAGGYYREGDMMDFTVSFSKMVTVDENAGTPYMELTVGTATVRAAYAGGSGSDALQFSYTVRAGDHDMDGIAVGGSIVPDGGTIRDVAGNDAVTELNNVGNTGGVLVNTTQPSVVLATEAVSPVTAPFVVIATFSEVVTGFALDDITVANATLGEFQTTDNITYTFLATPAAGGAVLVSVPANAAFNIAGNGNGASNVLDIQYNQTITGITLSDGGFVYDGTAKSLAVVGPLPVGASVSYAGNSRTDVGTQDVTATISGDNYETLVLTATLRITPATRTLAFPVFSAKTYGDSDFAAGASASSGEEIQYASSNTAVAEITAGGLIRINGAGEAMITATVPENGNYSNRPEVGQVLTVHQARQSITFNAPASVNRDAGSLSLDVSASSGLPVSLAVDDGQVATLEGTALHIHRLGTVTITATQAGDANHEAAEPVTVTLRVKDPSSDFPVRVHPAVSPNGDGINEFLMIEGIRDYPDNKVTLLNRNGTIVWEAIGYDNDRLAFRGIGTGQQRLPAGTYFYVVELRSGGSTEYRKGYFVLRY
ncbi:Ig-like domain-containing protein [Parapedobacter deserti]|uniref:Ig-like domain-containing protein n=1 Tax=Parapedobacter deserti TaxID=1912957 RepID=A0ABV7JKG1_9SPHI